MTTIQTYIILLSHTMKVVVQSMVN